MGGVNLPPNYFPQAAAVNNNVGGQYNNPDNWVQTENAIAAFARDHQNVAGAYVDYYITLIYTDDVTGRPDEIGSFSHL